MRTSIKIATLAEVLSGSLPPNTVVGNRRDEYGTFYVAFVATNPTDGKPIYDGDKDKVVLNWRRSTPRTTPTTTED